MIPVLCADKIGNTVLNEKTGEKYLQETARAFVLSAEISGLTAVFGNDDTYFSLTERPKIQEEIGPICLA